MFVSFLFFVGVGIFGCCSYIVAMGDICLRPQQCVAESVCLLVALVVSVAVAVVLLMLFAWLVALEKMLRMCLCACART